MKRKLNSLRVRASCSVVGDWVEWVHLDTADTSTVNDSESDVALVTPGGGPGVLDHPVLLTGGLINTPTCAGDGVIERGAALCGIEDTAGVGLEDHLVSLDRDGKSSDGEGGLHLVNVVGGDGDVGGDLGVSDSDGGVLAASSGFGASGSGGVWVVSLESDSAGLHVVESAVLHATIATEVAVAEAGAVDDLLLGEGLEVAVVLPVSSLEGSNGGESPA